MTKEQFIEALKKINIQLTVQQIDQLEKFYLLLLEWNEKMNLTRITNREEVYLKHFYDSLTLVQALDLKQEATLCDVGSGAGFPGIVLKIVFPQLKITLLDKLQKRVNYLNEVIRILNLKEIVAIHTRAQDYKTQTFDIVTARAVANLSALSDYCLPLVKPKGHFVAMKGHIEEELLGLDEHLQQHHAEIDQIVSFKLPYEESVRNLVVIKKL